MPSSSFSMLALTFFLMVVQGASQTKQHAEATCNVVGAETADSTDGAESCVSLLQVSTVTKKREHRKHQQFPVTVSSSKSIAVTQADFDKAVEILKTQTVESEAAQAEMEKVKAELDDAKKKEKDAEGEYVQVTKDVATVQSEVVKQNDEVANQMGKAGDAKVEVQEALVNVTSALNRLSESKALQNETEHKIKKLQEGLEREKKNTAEMQSVADSAQAGFKAATDKEAAEDVKFKDLAEKSKSLQKDLEGKQKAAAAVAKKVKELGAKESVEQNKLTEAQAKFSKEDNELKAANETVAVEGAKLENATKNATKSGGSAAAPMLLIQFAVLGALWSI